MTSARKATLTASVSAILIVETVLILSGWDLFAMLSVGGSATESTQIGRWLTYPVLGVLISSFMGGVTGHFIGMLQNGPAHTALTKKSMIRVAVFAFAFVFMWVFTAKYT